MLTAGDTTGEQCPHCGADVELFESFDPYDDRLFASCPDEDCEGSEEVEEYNPAPYEDTSPPQ